MAVLRLFAQAREAAGTGRDTVDGATVDEVLAAAACPLRRRASRRCFATCRIWLNGEPATGTTR